MAGQLVHYPPRIVLSACVGMAMMGGAVGNAKHAASILGELCAPAGLRRRPGRDPQLAGRGLSGVDGFGVGATECAASDRGHGGRSC